MNLKSTARKSDSVATKERRRNDLRPLFNSPAPAGQTIRVLEVRLLQVPRANVSFVSGLFHDMLPLRYPARQTINVNAIAITPGENRAVSGSRDETLRLWDLKSCKIIRTLLGLKILGQGRDDNAVQQPCSFNLGSPHAAALGSGERRIPAYARRPYKRRQWRAGDVVVDFQ